MSYAIPTNEITLTDIKVFKEAAIGAGIAVAEASGIGSRDSLTVRECNPAPDLSVPGAVGYTNNYYITPGAAGNLAWASVFDTAANPTLLRTQVAVFYKIMDASANPVITAVRFRVGPTGATTKASFFIQEFIDIKLEPEVWLSEPVAYEPEDVMQVEFYGRAATPAGGEELGFGCFIIERVGPTIS